MADTTKGAQWNSTKSKSVVENSFGHFKKHKREDDNVQKDDPNYDGGANGISLNKAAGSRYFCESLFWASQPKQAAKT
jgi:hypothetical protein